MLARRYRLTSGADISTTLRSGKRISMPNATLSLWITGGQSCPQVGLAVGKSVGNSVVRSRVSRVLRHGIAPLLAQLPPGSQLVIRALPGAERVNSAQWTQRLAGALGMAVPADGVKPLHAGGPVDKAVDVWMKTGDDGDV